MSIDERALRSLISLLDDDDPRSLELVRSRLLDQGTAAIPYLEEARASSDPAFGEKLEHMTEELRFHSLRREFAELAYERVPDLETGAFLLSRFGHPSADPLVYRAWLDRVAQNAADEIPEDAETPEAALRLTGYLFRTMGFAGNEGNYYDPDNSYLTRVIDTRRGIPVTLSTLALLVAKRLKIPLYGVGAPGHYLLGYRHDGEPRFIDAFRQGKLMDVRELRKMLVRNGYQFQREFLRPCGPRDTLIRMMRNLISIYQKTGAARRAERLSALVEIVVTGGAPEDA